MVSVNHEHDCRQWSLARKRGFSAVFLAKGRGIRRAHEKHMITMMIMLKTAWSEVC